jgi:hypothetical protein
MLAVDWHRAPLPKSQSRGLSLTWYEAEVLADIADGIDLTDMERRLALQGDSVATTLHSVWDKWRALNLGRDRLEAEWRGR